MIMRMKNMQTLKYFMRYFEPHCEERGGRRYCYVSALEYPEAREALDLLGGNGFFPGAPGSIVLKHAELVHENGEERWHLGAEEKPGTYPVWVAW
jgi:hypothetical protein